MMISLLYRVILKFSQPGGSMIAKQMRTGREWGKGEAG